MKIRILNCSSHKDSWYSSRIGEEFEVKRVKLTSKAVRFQVIEKSEVDRYIRVEDCAIIKIAESTNKEDIVDALVKDIAITTAYMFDQLSSPCIAALDDCYIIAKDFCTAYPTTYCWADADVDWETAMVEFLIEHERYSTIINY